MGFKTGLFTSPHIVDFEERFIINGRPVASESWVAVYRDIEPVIEELGLTFFEAATLIAFELFKREKVEWAVFETGLGGRLDATNILRPEAAVVTRLAMDHMDLLGNDLVAIAREKLGIVKAGVPLVMAEPDELEIRKLALDLCLQNGNRCQFVSASMAREIGQAGGTSWFTYDNQRYDLPLAGTYQIANALVAICALNAVGFENKVAIAEGIKSAFLPGRFETVEVKGKTVVFDVSHNPDAAKAFAETYEANFPGRKACLVTGIMKDKDAAGILRCYCSVASKIILTRPDVERSAGTAELKAKLPANFTGDIVEIPFVSEAVNAGIESGEDVICVAGSFFTVGEAMKALGIEPYGKMPPQRDNEK